MATALTEKRNSRMNFAHAVTIDDVSTGSTFFGNGGGRATEEIQVDFTSPKDFVLKLRDILGYSEVSGKGLSRKLPLQHSLYSWLFAETISGVKGLGYSAPAETGTGVTPTFPRVNVTVGFAARNYAMISDAAMAASAESGKERRRFCTRSRKTLTKILTIKKSQVKWLVVPAGETSTIEQGVPRTLTEGSYAITWHMVPRKFIYGEGDYLIQRIAGAVNALNHQEFDGFPAGTLLLEDVQLKEVMPAIPAEPFYADGAQPPLYLEVTFPFKVFSPPLKENGDKGDPFKSGHNSRISMTDGLAYPICEAISSPSRDQPLFLVADMTKLFEGP